MLLGYRDDRALIWSATGLVSARPDLKMFAEKLPPGFHHATYKALLQKLPGETLKEMGLERAAGYACSEECD